jgi:hypothetical protein
MGNGRRRFRYFGPWDNPQAALERWLAVKDDLLAGRPAPTSTDGLTVDHLVNTFLQQKKALLTTGEITPRYWDDCIHCDHNKLPYPLRTEAHKRPISM